MMRGRNRSSRMMPFFHADARALAGFSLFALVVSGMGAAA
jgi:hypothetical protein